MDLFALEAMLIRARLARRLVKDHHLTGVEALTVVVAPSPKLQRASEQVVERDGISDDTRKLYSSGDARDHLYGEAGNTPECAVPPGEHGISPVLPVTAGRPTSPDIVTIDELATKL